MKLQKSSANRIQTSPNHIEARHWLEWLDSAVDPDIIRLNVQSFEGQRPIEYLCYSDRLPRTNTGRLATWVLRRYTHTERGGWWCDGLDPLDNWQPMMWGCFKPDSPVRNEKGKLIKYEHPFKISTRAILLRVTWKIGLKIAANAGRTEEYERRIRQEYSRIETALEEGSAENKGFGTSSKVSLAGHKNHIGLHTGTRRVASGDECVRFKATAKSEFLSREDGDFWQWVYEALIPITLTEGAKKAGALLSAGYAALALPGIDGGYRTPKDAAGNKIGNSYLIPELKHFASGGRKIYICFDHDQKRKTIREVNRAISKTGNLLTREGSNIWVISWQQPEKGVDDFLFVHGEMLYERVVTNAATLELWSGKSYQSLNYAADVAVNRRYLGEITIPKSAQLVAIKSPKGTGKTHSLESVVGNALALGQWVLVVGHRVQLVEALCHRFGIPYITEVRSSEFGAVLGYGLCVDSLHPESQARFNAENWHNGVVIVDECEQVIWHTLNAGTCQIRRVAILQQLKTLLSNVLQGRGRVFLADADLSDLSIDFVRSLSGYDLDPYVVVNEWQPGVEERCRVYNYSGANPSGLVAALSRHIESGGRPFVVVSAQKTKSKWGSRTIETLLQKKYPEKKILRIDSETISDPEHPAYGCIAHLDEILPQYDIVIASPSIETGVSIDILGHFTSVWAIFQGVQSESSARQALFRLREPVSRHIWAAPHGIGQIGNGSTSVKSLLASQHKLAKANIRLLQELALDDIELEFQPESLRIWAKMAVRVNLGMIHYRQSILEGLKAEGHQIIESDEAVNDAVKASVTETKKENQIAEAIAVEAAADSTNSEFEQSLQKKAKTKSERYKERKHQLQLRYGIDVDAALVLKDDDGWGAKIKLHYYLTLGRQFLKQRDFKRLHETVEKGNGAAWLPDLNRSQLSVVIAVLENLGVLELLNPEREWRSTDEVLVRLSMQAIAHAWDIKAALNITVSEKDTPIAIAQKLLGKIGLKLEYLRREGSDGERVRVYGYTAPNDGRDEVFAAWIERDEANAAALNFTSTPGNKEIITSPQDVTELKKEAA